MTEQAHCWRCVGCGKVWISATGWRVPCDRQKCSACGCKRYPSVWDLEQLRRTEVTSGRVSNIRDAK